MTAQPMMNLRTHTRGTTVYVSKEATDILFERCEKVRQKNEISLSQRQKWGKKGPPREQMHHTMLWINVYVKLFRDNPRSELGECAVPKHIWIALHDFAGKLMKDVENACINNDRYKKNEIVVDSVPLRNVRESLAEAIRDKLTAKINAFLKLKPAIDEREMLYTTMPVDCDTMITSAIFVETMRSLVAARINVWKAKYNFVQLARPQPAYRSSSKFFQMLAKQHDFVYWHDAASYNRTDKFPGKIIDRFYSSMYNLSRYKLLKDIFNCDGVEMLLHAVSFQLCKWALVECDICCDIEPVAEARKKFECGTTTLMPHKLYWFPCSPEKPVDSRDNIISSRTSPALLTRELVNVDRKLLARRKTVAATTGASPPDIEIISETPPHRHIKPIAANGNPSVVGSMAKVRGAADIARSSAQINAHATSAIPVVMPSRRFSAVSSPLENELVIDEGPIVSEYNSPTETFRLPPLQASLPRSSLPQQLSSSSAMRGKSSTYNVRFAPTVPTVDGNQNISSFHPHSGSSHERSSNNDPRRQNFPQSDMTQSHSNLAFNHNNIRNSSKRQHPPPDGLSMPPGLPSQAKQIADARKRDKERQSDLAKSRTIALASYDSRNTAPQPAGMLKMHTNVNTATKVSAVLNASSSTNCALNHVVPTPIGDVQQSGCRIAEEFPTSTATLAPAVSKKSNLSPLNIPASPSTSAAEPSAAITAAADARTSTPTRARQLSGAVAAILDADELLESPVPTSTSRPTTPASAAGMRTVERPIKVFQIPTPASTVDVAALHQKKKRRNNSGQSASARTSSSGGGTGDAGNRRGSDGKKTSGGAEQGLSDTSSISSATVSKTSSDSMSSAKRENLMSAGSAKSVGSTAASKTNTPDSLKSAACGTSVNRESLSSRSSISSSSFLSKPANVSCLSSAMMAERRAEKETSRNVEPPVVGYAEVAVKSTEAIKASIAAQELKSNVNVESNQSASNECATAEEQPLSTKVVQSCNKSSSPSSCAADYGIAYDDVIISAPEEDVNMEDFLQAHFLKEANFVAEEAQDKLAKEAARADLRQKRRHAKAAEKAKSKAKVAASSASANSAVKMANYDSAQSSVHSRSFYKKRDASALDNCDQSADASPYDFVSSTQQPTGDGFVQTTNLRSKSKSNKKQKNKEKNNSINEKSGPRTVLRFGSISEVLPELPALIVDEVELAMNELFTAASGEKTNDAVGTAEPRVAANSATIPALLQAVPLVQERQPLASCSSSSSSLSSRRHSIAHQQQNLKTKMEFSIEHCLSGVDESAAQQFDRQQQHLASIGVVVNQKLKRPGEIKREVVLAALRASSDDDEFRHFSCNSQVQAAQQEVMVVLNNDANSE